MTNAVKEELKSFVTKVKNHGEERFVVELRKRINDHRLTHEQVAHITGKDRTTVTKWLNGERSLSVDAALLLAEFFKIKLITTQEQGEEHA